jgi:hypothetical protein
MPQRYKYTRMSAHQLSAALDELNITAGIFSRLCGAQYNRVKDWLDGREDIPHHVTVLCALLTMPGALEKARTVTDAMVEED